MAEQQEQQAKRKSKSKGYDLLQETIWTISFIRDVALGQALNADKGSIGITPEGEQGLGLLLAKVERDLNEAMDIL